MSIWCMMHKKKYSECAHLFYITFILYFNESNCMSDANLKMDAWFLVGDSKRDGIIPI